MPIMRPMRAATAALLVLACTGCGVAEEARKRMDEIMSGHVGSFERATRTKVEDAADGRTYLIRAKAREKAHWYEAWSAMSQLPAGYCPDGVPYSITRMTPADDPGANKPGEYTWHPAGTVFEQEISCSDPFAGERVIAADTDHFVAMDAVRTELLAGAAYDEGRHLVSSVSFNDRSPKYREVSRQIGGMVMRSHQTCREAGVQVKRILIHAKPTPHPSERVFLNRSEAFVGIEVVCADGLPADRSL